MKIVCGGRQTGKTLELIKISASNGGILICMNLRMVRYSLDLARKHGLKIPIPLTYSDVVEREKLRGIQNVVLLIDDLDQFMNYVFHYQMKVGAVSIYGLVQQLEPPKEWEIELERLKESSPNLDDLV